MGIPQQNNAVALAGTKGDVSPIEEKAPTLTTITRKEVGADGTKKEFTPHASPPLHTASPVASSFPNATTEVPGSAPPPRHEFGSDGEITNSVSSQGIELDGAHQAPVNQYPAYQESRQGRWGYQYPRQGQAYEVDSGQVQGYPRHGQHGGTFELGPGR